MNLIKLEVQDSIAVLRLQNRVTNAINLSLVVELENILSEVAQDPLIHSLVLTSANDKFFSIGFDIPGLFDLEVQDFKTFYRSFNRLCLDLYSFPRPTLAALPGHAIAGGCILALCCDYRMITRGRKLIGLNEIHLGVPVPYPADCILREIVGDRQARVLMEEGEFHLPEVALAIGLVDQILLPDDLEALAIKKMQTIGSLPRPAFAAIKRNRVEPVIEKIEQVLASKEEEFTKHWYALETRALLADAREKF